MNVGFDSERTKELRKARAVFDLVWMAVFVTILIINIVLFSIGLAQADVSDRNTAIQAASVLTLIASVIILLICLVVYIIKRKGYSERLALAVQIDAENFVRERVKQRDKYKEEDERDKAQQR